MSFARVFARRMSAAAGGGLPGTAVDPRQRIPLTPIASGNYAQYFKVCLEQEPVVVFSCAIAFIGARARR